MTRRFSEKPLLNPSRFVRLDDGDAMAFGKIVERVVNSQANFSNIDPSEDGFLRGDCLVLDGMVFQVQQSSFSETTSWICCRQATDSEVESENIPAMDWIAWIIDQEIQA